MANWTIRSKTEKTSLASTDGVPMQEAGGTTKWFSLSTLATSLGIPGGVASSAVAAEMRALSGGTFIEVMTANFFSRPDALEQQFALDTTVTDLPFTSIWYCTVRKNADNNWAEAVIKNYFDKRSYIVRRFNGAWEGSWTQLTDANGNPVFHVVATTASAANAYIAGSDNTILQSTSSAKYKTDIRDLDDTSTLDALRPVLYKSNPETVPGDDPTLDHYGFIAEELHEIDEKLVQYKEDESGEKTPNGVQYDRVVVLLVKRIQELEARLAKAGI